MNAQPALPIAASADRRRIDRRKPRTPLARLLERLALMAIGWGAAVTLIVFSRFIGDDRAIDARMGAILSIFFAGAVIEAVTGFPTAVILVMRRRQKTARFAAMVVSLTLGTIGFTGFLFYLHFNRYYAAWHAEPFTHNWLWQTLLTGAQAVYIFAVTGMPLLFPAGIPLLFAAGLLFSRTDGRRGAVRNRRNRGTGTH
ncbi:hypothetical protein [Breoghania sp.]|uniref:hypothetical protein n=1 Tax=Breoghania sp. TaxID=2065378 RepID=UPI00261F4009|nr:hypothetical protein [Breoghania sp.]MDJ0931384.1 hypothetical protein [Breoghania sp.]